MADYSQARAIIGTAEIATGEDVQKALLDHGFGETLLFTSLVKLHEAIRRETPELLILDVTMEGTETSFITQEIRSGKLGKSPFPIILVLVAEPDRSLLQLIADSGADSALLRPFPSDTLREKVTALSGTRVPFVVTRDYIGPDRRSAPRPGAMSARLVEVPNPLAPHPDAARYAAACEQACREVFAERVVRLAAQVEWLARSINDGSTKGEDLQPLFWKIEDATRELALRVGNPAQIQQIRNLRSYAQTLRRTQGDYSSEALKELLTLSQDLLLTQSPAPSAPAAP
jgi:CheY-like chemotaxis protein